MKVSIEHYRTEVLPKLSKDLGISNPMAVPKLTKIVVNSGLGEALTDKKVIEKVSIQLAVICGQKPKVTYAKQAISSFKLREGDPIGLKVTLRGKRMYDFLTKLVSISFPRVRDFRGIPNRGFDGNGNYTLGMAEQTIFPELDYSLVDKPHGFEITFVTSARTDDAARQLLVLLGLPFEKTNEGA